MQPGKSPTRIHRLQEPTLTTPMTETEQAQEQVVRDLEARLRLAQLASDVATLEQLIADDLLFAGPDGALVSKADDLAAYRDKMLCITAHQPEDLQVRAVRADVLLVSLRARVSGSYAGAPFSALSRYTRVWAKGAGGWRIVGGQVGMVPDHAA